MSAIAIRAAAAADLDVLAAWAQAMAWETERRRLDSDVVRRGIAAALADAGKARYFIAMREAPAAGGEVLRVPAGTLMLTTEWSDWRCGDWWWIQSVYVAPEHRRAGVYAALHRHVQALAEATPQVCGLRLYVEKDNAAAQRVYEALGMRDTGYRVYELALPRR